MTVETNDLRLKKDGPTLTARKKCVSFSFDSLEGGPDPSDPTVDYRSAVVLYPSRSLG